jgi:hypothetical protein
MALPQDATGPMPVHTGKGVQYIGGSGGHGLDLRVSTVRIMDPTLLLQMPRFGTYR